MTQQATIEVPGIPAEDEGAVSHQIGELRGEPGRDAEEALIADELLVEEVSIDGMCGVY